MNYDVPKELTHNLTTRVGVIGTIYSGRSRLARVIGRELASKFGLHHITVDDPETNEVPLQLNKENGVIVVDRNMSPLKPEPAVEGFGGYVYTVSLAKDKVDEFDLEAAKEIMESVEQPYDSVLKITHAHESDNKLHLTVRQYLSVESTASHDEVYDVTIDLP